MIFKIILVRDIDLNEKKKVNLGLKKKIRDVEGPKLDSDFKANVNGVGFEIDIDSFKDSPTGGTGLECLLAPHYLLKGLKKAIVACWPSCKAIKQVVVKDDMSQSENLKAEFNGTVLTLSGNSFFFLFFFFLKKIFKLLTKIHFQ